MTRYVEAFSWTASVGRFLMEQVRERPLLHVCAGRSQWLDVTLERAVTLDISERADVRASWTALPFKDGSFRAVFADPPWDGSYKRDIGAFMRESLRVAEIVYVMSPWLYGCARARVTRAWVRQMPGVNQIIGLVRYERSSAPPLESEGVGVRLSKAQRST